MIETCFSSPRNRRPKLPTSYIVSAAQTGSGFESKAFTALWLRRENLQIRTLWRCRAARVDGYLETRQGEIILLEMKETLSWGSTQAAGFQFLAGRQLLNLQATRGIIVFERHAPQWERSGVYGAWGQLALEASVVREHIEIGALQVIETQVHSHPHTTQ